MCIIGWKWYNTGQHMDIPKINFVRNKKTEVERLVHTAKQVWSGFYFKKGFAVTPKLLTDSVSTVVLPDIGLEKIQNFEELLYKVVLNFPIVMPDELKNEICNLYKFVDSNTDFEKNWLKIEKPFWGMMEVLFPKILNNIKNVEVRVTEFGTISSYQFINKSSKKLIVYLRKDGDISNLAEAIMTALIFPYLNEMEMVWEEAEAMVDFVLTNSKLKTELGKYRPTLKNLRNVNRKTEIVESRKYLNKLGVCFEKPLTINRGKIELRGGIVDSKFTLKQKQLTIKLLENGGFLSFEEVSKILWDDDENKFSLWAMNKYIERLRGKLINLGLMPQVLKTLRGRGICLEN